MALAEPTTGTQEPTPFIRTASVPIIPDVSDDSNLEEGRRADDPLLSAYSNNNNESNANAASSSAPHQSNWRNLSSSMSFSALSGDTMWHSAQNDRSR
jgi:hypothetical protein